ncbi:MAG: hypothetical protein ACOX9R_11205 [Armatimonadota bacterium]|jgi:hypothetical protein
MRTMRMLLAVVLLACLVATGAVAQDFLGPRLDGTVTLRGGEQVSGVILTAQLGIVDGAEIGSRLRDGGYIAVRVDGDERRMNATEIASVDVEWSQTGTEADPKWKITNLSVTTQSGEVVSGQPAWLVHATSLIVQTEDGTQQKIYAFPMAGSNFSPDNLMTSISLAPVAAPAEEPAPVDVPVTEEPAAEEPAADQPVVEEPVAEEPAAEEPAAEEPAAEEPVVVEQPVTDTVTVEPEIPVGMGIGQPTVEAIPEGTVFATGQPAVITFEVTNPETGNPMQVRFLIVPLPAQ